MDQVTTGTGPVPEDEELERFGTHVGWWFGWMSFAFLTIVTVSVDYGLVEVAFQPLIGEAFSPTSAVVDTLIVLALQAALIIVSTRATTRVNNVAVATEIIGIAGLTVLLLIVATVRSLGHWSNLGATGAVPHLSYYGWLGPFMLATLLGAYTIVGFESASNLAEETHEPHRVIPRAMIRAVLVSGVVGFLFLLVLAFATNKAAYASTAPRGFDRARRAGRRGAEDLPGLRVRVDLRLRPDHHGDQRPADLLHGAGPPTARSPVPVPGAEGHRRPGLGHDLGRGAGRGHHASAADPRRGAGHAVHRVDNHAGPAVRGHGAALHVHVPAGFAAGDQRRAPSSVRKMS
jgi:hypothetical protein